LTAFIQGIFKPFCVCCKYAVKPILLYGCEIWGFSNLDTIERVHLKLGKLLLHLKKSTPSFMIYGELGACPMSVYIQTRIVNFTSYEDAPFLVLHI
jgi:hypothetical protein